MFKGVDLILHAGDIGNLNILYELTGIAPTEAVFGNMDPCNIREETREEIVLKLKGHTIGLSHGGGSPHTIVERLANRFSSRGTDIVVFGHTHEPMERQVGDIFFFNPGYGRKTIGFLELNDNGGFRTRVVKL